MLGKVAPVVLGLRPFRPRPARASRRGAALAARGRPRHRPRRPARPRCSTDRRAAARPRPGPRPRRRDHGAAVRRRSVPRCSTPPSDCSRVVPTSSSSPPPAWPAWSAPCAPPAASAWCWPTRASAPSTPPSTGRECCGVPSGTGRRPTCSASGPAATWTVRCSSWSPTRRSPATPCSRFVRASPRPVAGSPARSRCGRSSATAAALVARVSGARVIAVHATGHQLDEIVGALRDARVPGEIVVVGRGVDERDLTELGRRGPVYAASAWHRSDVPDLVVTLERGTGGGPTRSPPSATTSPACWSTPRGTRVTSPRRTRTAGWSSAAPRPVAPPS